MSYCANVSTCKLSIHWFLQIVLSYFHLVNTFDFATKFFYLDYSRDEALSFRMVVSFVYPMLSILVFDASDRLLQEFWV